MNHINQHVQSGISVKTTHCSLFSLSSNLFIILVFLASATTLSGCKKDTKRELYSQSYDELVTYYINIDSLAKGMNVKVADLIKMRYGLIESNPYLASEMAELTEAYIKFDNKKARKILNKEHSFELDYSLLKDAPSATKLKQLYGKIAYTRNESFEAKIPTLAGKETQHKIEAYLDNKFKWYKFPINGWDYLMEGKEALRQQYNNEIKAILSPTNIDKIIVTKFNNYQSLLSSESQVLFQNRLDLPALKDIENETTSNISTSKLLQSLVERSSTDLTDLLLTLIEDVGIALIIWAVFSFIIDHIENSYAERQIGYVPGAGWLNVAFFACDMWNFWEEDYEVRKWKRIKGWTQGIIFATFLVLTWIYVIKPSGQLENNIISTCESQIAEYINKIDLPIQEFFNNIVDSIL